MLIHHRLSLPLPYFQFPTSLLQFNNPSYLPADRSLHLHTLSILNLNHNLELFFFFLLFFMYLPYTSHFLIYFLIFTSNSLLLHFVAKKKSKKRITSNTQHVNNQPMSIHYFNSNSITQHMILQSKRERNVKKVEKKVKKFIYIYMYLYTHLTVALLYQLFLKIFNVIANSSPAIYLESI